MTFVKQTSSSLDSYVSEKARKVQSVLLLTCFCPLEKNLTDGFQTKLSRFEPRRRGGMAEW